MISCEITSTAYYLQVERLRPARRRIESAESCWATACVAWRAS